MRGRIVGGGLARIIALGNSGLYTSSNGESYKQQSTIITGGTFNGYAFNDAVSLGNVAYVPARNGNIYTTIDFRTFTQVTISSIQNNTSAAGYTATQFQGGASLFKLNAHPTRIFAVAYHPVGSSNENDAVSIWYSTDNCITWTIFSQYIGGVSASQQCGKIVDGLDGNLYASISAFGSSVTLVRIRISDGVVIGSVNGGASGSDLLVINANTLYLVQNNTRSNQSGGTWNTFVSCGTLPSGFTGTCGAFGTISGSPRIVLLGKNSGTGRLQIIYSSNVESAWTATTMPSITVANIGIGWAQIASLGTDKGFVAVYGDVGDGNNSGALYSIDGITWTQATTENPSFSSVSKVYANPLVG